jgi:hypothetical protein
MLSHLFKLGNPMTIRAIVFCDKCNPQGVRYIEARGSKREDPRAGRRNSDGRAWIEGEEAEIIKNGWVSMSDGSHICPNCLAQKL